MSIIEEISAKLQAGKAKDIRELVPKALEEGHSAGDILEKGLLAGMSVVGEKFKNNEVYVPEVLIAARAMKTGVELLQPYLKSEGAEPLGKACIGTVEGDLHDIGKNLVKMMLEGKGIEVVDLGVDVSPAAFVAAAKEQGCTIIACSALLTTTMVKMREVVEACEAAGIRDQVKIMVGGAPVTEAFCRSIGADGYCADAASAADMAASFCR
ncbi:MAG: corrinoid protein [Clostridia bacterium]|nr:corrinoid protein [Clostridia bacterium]